MFIGNIKSERSMQNNMLNNKLIVFDFIHFRITFQKLFQNNKTKQKLIYLVILFTVIKIQQLISLIFSADIAV
ncbi:MAG: hypothetical protein JWQ06_2195 [Mucilaginibacter sp.]|nr:hypothetical protein [Mucilaginibacter sp.]